MSGFVWAKFLMLAQLDVLAVFGWVVVALFGVATMVMYPPGRPPRPPVTWAR